LLGQDGSCSSNVRLRLSGCKDLGKSIGANNYLGGRRRGSSRIDWRDNRRYVQRATRVGGCVGGSHPLGSGSFGGVHTD
jgi:hypothetical protein